MKQLNSEQIHTRLAEITQAQAAHDARDMDAELAAVMKSGGDVDAIEAAQLEAERQARRLRAEKKALEAMLPETEQAEAQAKIDKLVQSVKGHPERLRKIADTAVQAIAVLRQAHGEQAALHRERYALWQETADLCRSAGLPDDLAAPLAKISSAELTEALQDLRGLPDAMANLNSAGGGLDARQWMAAATIIDN